MFKFLICYGLIHTIAALPQSKYYGSTPKDVEVFASLYPGVKVPDPPLPQSPGKRKSKTTTVRPTYSTPDPNSPSFYPKKPPSSTKKPSVTTKFPPIYPWTSKKPINFPSPIYPSFGSNNIPLSTTSQPPHSSTTGGNWWPSSRWPVTPSKPQIFPSSTPLTWQSKYPSTVESGSRGTPAWIYPPRPSWPRSHHLMGTAANSHVEGAVQHDVEGGGPVTGYLSEYQAYKL